MPLLVPAFLSVQGTQDEVDEKAVVGDPRLRPTSVRGFFEVGDFDRRAATGGDRDFRRTQGAARRVAGRRELGETAVQRSESPAPPLPRISFPRTSLSCFRSDAVGREPSIRLSLNQVPDAVLHQSRRRGFRSPPPAMSIAGDPAAQGQSGIATPPSIRIRCRRSRLPPCARTLRVTMMPRVGRRPRCSPSASTPTELPRTTRSAAAGPATDAVSPPARRLASLLLGPPIRRCGGRTDVDCRCGDVRDAPMPLASRPM